MVRHGHANSIRRKQEIILHGTWRTTRRLPDRLWFAPRSPLPDGDARAVRFHDCPHDDSGVATIPLVCALAGNGNELEQHSNHCYRAFGSRHGSGKRRRQALRDGHFVAGDEAKGEKLGQMEAGRWTTMYNQLLDLKVIDKPFDPATAYTLQFVGQN